MATAGDGGARSVSAYEGGGGAGGKLRVRPFRKATQATPYDRPPTTLHNSSYSNGNNNGSWLSKMVVDPASKILSASAHYFFSSVLRKRLPSTLSSIPPLDTTQEQSDGLQVKVPVKHDGEVSAVVEDDNHTDGSNDSGISKLEQMLRQKTFTRSEIDRLSELLRSRTVDLPVVDRDHNEANCSKQVSKLEKHQGVANSLAKENKIIGEGFNGIISTPVVSSRDTGFTNEVNGGSQLSSSNHAWKLGANVVSKQVALKRRSSVIEDEIGSLRRVRQKPNLLSQGNPLSICRVDVGYDSRQSFLSSTEKPIVINEPVNKVSKIAGGNEDKDVPSTSYASVPSKSSEMATKILHHLEKLTPKEKSSESKLFSARDKLPSKLTQKMLHGSALKSLKDMDSPKLFQNGEGNSHMLKGMQNALFPDVHDSTSEKRGKVEENGIRKFSVSPNMSIPVKNGDTAVSAKDVISSSRMVDTVSKDLVVQPAQKKWAFQISAQEDSLELDVDIHSNGPSSTSAAELKEKPEASVVEKEIVSNHATKVINTSSMTESKTRTDPVLNKTADFGPSDVSVVGVKKNGFTISTSFFNASSHKHMLSQSAPENGRSAAAEEENSPLLFSFSSKGGDKVPQNAYSSMSLINEPSGPKYNATSNLSPASSNSFASVQLKVPEPEKVDNKNTDNSGGTIGTLKAPFVTGSTSASTSSAFCFDRLTKNSNSPNGSLASSPIAVTVPASINSMNQIFNIGSHVASSSSSSLDVASTTTMASSASTVVPSFTTSSILKFGSSGSSNSVSVAPTTLTAEPYEINSKSEKEGTVGKLNSSVFGSTSFTTGGSIFGLNSSGTSSTMNSQSQGSLFVTENGLFSTQLSPLGSGDRVISQSMPIQFGSYASSSVFGTTAITSSSNSLFAFSTSAKLFGTGSSFGHNSLAYSAETESTRSSSSGMSSTFNFGTISSSSSSGSNSISSSAAATSSIFNFSVNSATSSSAPNSINSNTADTPNEYAFGANSLVSASISGSSTSNPSTVATLSVFTLGGSSLASPLGTNSISSVSGATSSVFSSSWQPSLLSSTLSLPSPTVFSFGASSSSFAATSGAPMFGASTGSIFSLTSASASTTSLASQSQPIFGSSTSVIAAPLGKSDQMNMEDSVAEDTMHAAPPAVPVFGQPPSQTGSMFGSTAPLSATPFQSGGQQNQTAQIFSPFQASTSLEFNAGGSFSLGSGGDKSNRKFVKVSKSRNRRK